jgi:hypothetical protein
MKLPTLDAWNFTYQRQVTNSLSTEIAFVGNKGTHVFVGNGPNYDSNPIFYGAGTSINGSFTPAVPQAQRRPYYNKFTTVYNGTPVVCCDGTLYNTFNNVGNTQYRGLQVKVNKRFTEGLQFLAHYTWSRAYNYTDGNFLVDRKAAWGRDDFNRNHVFSGNFVYELPFGRGKKFGGGMSHAADLALGGWQLTGTVNLSSGLPWTPTYGECGQDKDTGPCMPNGNGSFHVGAGSFDPVKHQVVYFTPITPLTISAPAGTDYCTVARPSGQGFSRPACSVSGNVQRNSFSGPSGFYSDASLVKAFHITERYRAEFRVDAYNVFNHPVYGFSSQDYGATGGTCIDCTGNNGLIKDIEQGSSMRQLQLAVRFSF